MIKKIKISILKIDQFFFKLFGSHKSTKLLENIKEAQIIFSHLNKIGEESKVRFVGGCVRKVLSGEEFYDIDLATLLTPEEVKDELSKNGIKVIDTGILHGTVTAILNDKKFEITTLRKDVKTDGRHAQVQFTSNWELDALRRDFTINAIYADINGRILDPQKGISDLNNGRVKFIGSSSDRIKEDYLRILRYFRFFTEYSKNKHDNDTLQSIKQNINGINKISNERIFDELKKIFLLKNVNKLFHDEQSTEIILNIFPQFKHSYRLNKLAALNPKIRNKFDEYLVLALLIVDESNNYEYFCYKYKISNDVKSRLKYIAENFSNLKNKKFYFQENIKKLIYFNDKDRVIDLLLFSSCMNNKINIEELLEFIINYKTPKFPVSGDYLKKYGFETGQLLGKKLKLLEEKWIENNFNIDKNEIERILNASN